MPRKTARPPVYAALAGLIVLVPWASLVQAAEQNLAPQRAAGEVSRVEVLLEVGGDLSLFDDKEKQLRPLKMSVVGSMVYNEKLLPGAADQPAGELRALREYARSDAVIKIDKGGTKPKLRDERLLMAVSSDDRGVTLFSPAGPLTREELDLLQIPGCSLLVERLLPDRAVSPGDEWQHSNDLMSALLNLDAVSECDVTSHFKEANASAAQIELSGKVRGAVEGVATEIEVKGRYKFDLAARRVTWLALLVKEKRSIGHVSPGVDVVARLQMKIIPGVESQALADPALAELAFSPSPELTLLEYQSARGHFRFLHERRWHVVSEEPNAVALRMVDRGELVAQCNISALEPVAAGKRMTLDRFQEDVKRALGKNLDRFMSAGESTNSAGHDLCRLVAVGEVEKLPIQWNYYLVADAQGHQAALAFTMETELVDRFGTSAEPFVSTFEFVPEKKETAAQPTLAPVRK